MQKSLDHSIFENAVLINLSIRSFGNRRSLPASAIQTDSAREMVGGHKKLMVSPLLDAISNLDRHAVHWLQSRTVSTLFKKGIHVLPVVLVPDVQEHLEYYEEARQMLVYEFGEPTDDPMFADKYEELLYESKLLLKSNFRRGDYPNTVEEFMACFRVDWSYLEFQTPNKLKDFSPGLYIKQEQQLKARVEEISSDIETVLHLRVQKMLDDMLDSLTGGEDGKPKKFGKDKLEKLNDFCATLPKLNITDSKSIDELSTKLSHIIGGVDVKELKKSSDLQQVVIDGLQKCTNIVNTFLVNKPKRSFSLPTEEED